MSIYCPVCGWGYDNPFQPGAPKESREAAIGWQALADMALEVHLRKH